MPNYRIWVHDKDGDGNPLDEQILKAAKEIGTTLTHYRAQEVNCESTANGMLQDAVEAASTAARRAPIDNPKGYLASTYKRMVDRYLRRRDQHVLVEDDFLEQLSNSGPRESPEDSIHNRLLLEKLLDSMDREARQICVWRLQGFTNGEIATKLGITANALTVRYAREMKKVVARVLQHNKGP